mgnify:FL=1
MKLKDRLSLLLNLRLFDGAAGGAGAGGEGAAPTGEGAITFPSVAGKVKRANPLGNVVYGKQVAETGAATAEPDKPQANQSQDAAEGHTTITTSDTLEAKKAEFEKLIGGDYKDLFDERIQSIINKRFKETKTLESQLGKMNPILEMLTSKYGESDPEKLATAIEEDDSYYEEEASKKGISVEQLKQMKKLERENSRLKEAQQETERRQNADRIYADWLSQGEKLKSQFPSFDFESEIQNPSFTKLLSSGIDVKTAYQTIHMDDIMGGAMQYTAQKTAEQVVNNIKSRAARPIENGVAAQSGVVVKNDVSKFTAADRAEVIRRVRAGERIQF